MRSALIFFLVLFCVACSNKKAFQLNSIQLPVVVEHSANRKSLKIKFDDSNCVLSVPAETECSLSTMERWLSSLEKIEFLSDAPPGNINTKPDFLKVSSSNNSIYAEIFKTKTGCFISLKDKSSNKSDKKGMITPKDCDLLFPLPRKIIDTRLIPFEVSKATYIVADKVVEISDEKLILLKSYLKAMTFKKFVHLGSVNSGITKSKNINENKNNNLTGVLQLVDSTGSRLAKLNFGKPIEGSALTNIWVEGQTNIKQFEVRSWPKLRKLLTPN